MVSGGQSSQFSVEHHHLSDGIQVAQGLPDLPLSTSGGHTSDGNIVCGGANYPSHCITLNEDKSSWAISHNLTHARTYHSSWVVNDGIVLMGGTSSAKTSELMRDEIIKTNIMTAKNT